MKQNEIVKTDLDFDNKKSTQKCGAGLNEKAGK